MGLHDGAQQLMQQQQQEISDAAKAKAVLASVTERMQALVPRQSDGQGVDVFEGVEVEVRGLREKMKTLEAQLKRQSMEDKIVARQQALELQQQAAAATTSPSTASGTLSRSSTSPVAAAAMITAAQVPHALINHQSSRFHQYCPTL
jgi:hypothetical protein